LGLAEQDFQKISFEGESFSSLKVADLRSSNRFDPAIEYDPMLHSQDLLRIADSISFLSRFNDDKEWTEFVLSRMIPYVRNTKCTFIAGITADVHPYPEIKKLEAAADAVIEITLRKIGKDDRGSFISVKGMRNISFDSHWFRLKVDVIGKYFEVTVEKPRVQSSDNIRF
jgi:hypothetical protein